jgi:hypothetical protein
MYRHEWALAQVGAADIIYGNGEPPDSTNPDHRPGLCVAHGTLVSTLNGDLPIQEVREGTLVLTLDGWRTVVAAESTGRKEVFRLTTKAGFYVDITEDHPVLTVKDGVIGWYPLRELEQGDTVFQLLPPSAGGVVRALQPAAVLAGILIAEGREYGYAPVEPVVRQIFESNYRKVFGGYPNYANGKAQHILLKDANRVAQALGFTLRESTEQRIPPGYLSKDVAFRSSLVYGLFLGDGWVGPTSASYGTSSLGLAKDVQQLLRTLGVYSSIRKNGSDTLWHVRVPPSSRARLLSLFGKYKFKYALDRYKPPKDTACTEYLLDTDLRSWWAQLRAYARTETLQMPTTLTYLVRVTGDPQLKKLATDYSDYRFKVKLESSDKPISFTYKEVNELIERATHLESHLSKVVPVLPASTSKSKLRKWLTTCAVHNTQTVLFKSLLQPGVTAQEIRNITPLGVRKVYDLQVSDSEHFTANGIVVHNCKHLLALRALIKTKHGI